MNTSTVLAYQEAVQSLIGQKCTINADILWPAPISATIVNIGKGEEILLEDAETHQREIFYTGYLEDFIVEQHVIDLIRNMRQLRHQIYDERRQTKRAKKLQYEYAIYTLVDPRTHEVRYVGYSCQLEQRYQTHLSCSDTSNPVRNEWITELLEAGLAPVICIVDTAHGIVEAKKKESHWIQHFKHITRLTNLAENRDSNVVREG